MRRFLVSTVAGTVLAVSPFCSVFAAAASQSTDAYLANLRVNLGFLKESGRLAADHAQSATIKALAVDEADNLPSPEGAVPVAEGTGVNLPVTVAAGLRGDSDDSTGEIQTGRSAYSPDHPVPPGEIGAVASSAALGYGLLASTNGEAFDALYRSTHISALKQLSDLYYSYSVTGDNPALRAEARRDLPMIKVLLDQARQAN